MRVGDKVFYRGELYDVIRNRDNGMFDIAHVLERYESGAPKVLTGERKCLYADEMQSAVKCAECGEYYHSHDGVPYCSAHCYAMHLGN